MSLGTQSVKSGDCHVVTLQSLVCFWGRQYNSQGNQYRFILVLPRQPQKGLSRRETSDLLRKRPGTNMGWG